MINGLVSYAYLRSPKAREKFGQLIAATRPYMRWILDSGGYTIATQGLEINVQDYIADLKAGDFKDLFWQYVALDEPLNWGRSREHLETMLDAGLKPMPVLTADADVENVSWLAKVNPCICLAGGINEEFTYYARRIAQVRRKGEHEGVNMSIHGLGFTRGVKVARTAVTTVDSSTWLTGKQYGNFSVFDPLHGCRQFNTKKLLQSKGRQMPPLVAKLFMRHGVTLPALLRIYRGEALSRAHGTVIDLLTCYAWLEYSEYLRAHGISFFFASGSMHCMPPLFSALKSFGTPHKVAELEEFAWYLQNLQRDDFPKFLDEVVVVLRDASTRPVFTGAASLTATS